MVYRAFYNYDWFFHLATLGTKGGQMTKPIIIVKMPCKLLYVIKVKRILNKMFHFLALLDTRIFGHL